MEHFKESTRRSFVSWWKPLYFRWRYKKFYMIYGNQFMYLGFDNVICPTIQDQPIARRSYVDPKGYRFFNQPGLISIYHGIWTAPK